VCAKSLVDLKPRPILRKRSCQAMLLRNKPLPKCAAVVVVTDCTSHQRDATLIYSNVGRNWPIPEQRLPIFSRRLFVTEPEQELMEIIF
jgi:hypothetical protein